ncbi:MAG: hypothetical protein ABH854_04125 [Candidatus Diapherotrites archaeon]|nr:hypothetical protein [Candidatus Micrarchaeota archaeon]MBU1939737.1 hypothetical protein [Candidatus Micrarchaeota archaeon]
MPLNFLMDILLSVISLLWGSILVSIPAFILVAIASFARRKIATRYKLGWLKSGAIASYILVLLLIFVLYYSPLLLSLGQETAYAYPAELAPSAAESLSALALGVLRLFFIAVVLTTIIIPLEILGAIIFDALAARFPKLNHWALTYAATLAVTFIAAVLLIFIVPWAFAGILYFIFYG